MYAHNIIVTSVLSVLTFPKRGVHTQFYSDRCVISVDFPGTGCAHTMLCVLSVLTFPERVVRPQYYSDRCVISVDFPGAGCAHTIL